MSQQLIFTNEVAPQLDGLIAAHGECRVFLIADVNTATLVLPRLLHDSARLSDATVITIPAGDTNKNLESVARVWKQLSDNGATRSSLVINIGGGMVTDLGAFAAATFKRGVRFINVPTTLLAAVDASVGGKTGFNFNGLKNEIGLFREADAVVISTCFFDTLPVEELKSGYAEMLKHGFLTSANECNELMNTDITQIAADRMLTLLERSVKVKCDIVAQDPTEHGIRRALNLGHTAGHAFESFALAQNRPIPHGYAVAHGLLVALILSHMKAGLDSGWLYKTAAWISDNYGTLTLTCDDYPTLLRYMSHDKKNDSPDRIAFTLIATPGDVRCGVIITPADITAALDIYRDLLHV
ncbi:MAG: 3-dehydroquinate synthase [Muribaculaceae bacterium]|nr:3-dehydroquinate synthase [Muribaculaceae bacterium]